MLWRGMYDDALKALVVAESYPAGDGERILSKTLEGVALAHLQEFSAAEQKIKQADAECSTGSHSECGGVIRAFGVLAIEQGDYNRARQRFLESLSFARLHGDPWLEATALLNLGVAALQTEHFDEAVDWSKSALGTARVLGGDDLEQTALGNLGWAYFRLGDIQQSLTLSLAARRQAQKLGNIEYEHKWLTNIGYIYMESNQIDLARKSYIEALNLARGSKSREDIQDVTTDLAQVAMRSGNPKEAKTYSDEALSLAKRSGSQPDMADALAMQMQVAALGGDVNHAKELLREVEANLQSQESMKWACELAMARLYESQGQTVAAHSEYTTALATFESARAQLKREDSQLPFLANATRIYDDYIHFLVQQGKIEEALQAADQSRARTLSQGLDVAQRSASTLSPRAVAAKEKATLLFYWLGEKQSYLWAVTSKKVNLIQLPAQSQIAPLIDRYSNALLGPEDPIAAGNADGRALFRTLVAPATPFIDARKPVMVLADGPLFKINFETLIAPATDAIHAAHYWIEDATILSAPSLAMLAVTSPAHPRQGNLLLMGNAISPDADYPALPYAPVEMQSIEKHFPKDVRAVYALADATPDRYLKSNPRQYDYIHFVSHGVASRTDPLDSAIILSKGTTTGEGFKLYARDIMQHPLDARLVTISACYGSGTRIYAGEGLVGLSWAFLYAGAHNAIGALWEASDRSTAELMGTLYQGLETGEVPAQALREAKLALLHSHSGFSRPFYWAPFQLYTR